MKTLLVLAILSASITLSAAEAVDRKSIDEAIARGNLEAVQSFLAADPALSIARQRGDAAVISSIEKPLNTP